MSSRRGLVLATMLVLCTLAIAAGAHAQQPPAAPATEAQPGTPPALSKPLQPKTAAQREPEAQRVTDGTAYTLQARSLRVGLFRIEYGIFDFLSVATYTLPWGVLAPTVIGKLRLLKADPIAIAVQTGFAYFDSTRLKVFDSSPGNAIVTVFPVEAFASYRFGEAFTLSAGAAYTEVAVSGALQIEAFDGAGRGVADNAQLTAGAELRFSRAVALIVNGRWLMLQRVSGSAKATLHPDAFTTVAVNGNVGTSSFEVRDAFSVVPSLLLSLGALNLRFGVGYGNFNVPLVNFVLPRRTLIPEFDLYLVF